MGDITVVGQRRSSSLDDFPSTGSTGWAGDPRPPFTDREWPDGEPPPPQEEFNPCAYETTRKIWDADARAATAVADLVAKAASLNDSSTLANREFGANLFLNSVGAVELTDISVGPTPFSGTIPEVTIQPGGTTYLNWMGDIHNHPSGDPRPSGAEWSRFVSRIDAIQSQHTQRTEVANVSIYIAVQDAITGETRLYAYKKGDDPEQTGNEVNPNAQPCPR